MAGKPDSPAPAGTSAAPDGRAVRSGFLTWVVVLCGLTVLGTGWLVLTGVNPREEFSPAIVLIGYSPSLAALLVAGLVAGARGVRSLLRPLAVWRVGVHWYVLVLVAPLMLALAATLIQVALDGEPPARWLVLPSAAGVGALIGPLIAGSLGEEIGWRGFAQPRLQARYRALTASIIIGVLWATWHHWTLLAPGGAAEPLDVLAGYIRLVSTAVLYGWLYNTTRSLLLVMVAHAGHNIAVDLVAAPGGEHQGMWHLCLAVCYLAAAIAVGNQLRRPGGHS